MNYIIKRYTGSRVAVKLLRYALTTNRNELERMLCLGELLSVLAQGFSQKIPYLYCLRYVLTEKFRVVKREKSLSQSVYSFVRWSSSGL